MNCFNFLSDPNLPENKVLYVVVSDEYAQIIDGLNKIGLKSICVSECKDILKPVSHHADMLFTYLGNGEFICEKSQLQLSQRLESLGFSCVSMVELREKYPFDISLNSCIVKSKIICKNSHTPLFLKKRFKVLNVSQGYAKCSCVVVDENSVITDDESIHLALSVNGFDSLLVRKGSVKLSGYDYGFIGGCCGKVSKDTIAFCGDLRTHSDYKQIDAFLRERNVYPYSLTNGNLLDIGSIIPVMEEK